MKDSHPLTADLHDGADLLRTVNLADFYRVIKSLSKLHNLLLRNCSDVCPIQENIVRHTGVMV